MRKGYRFQAVGFRRGEGQRPQQPAALTRFIILHFALFILRNSSAAERRPKGAWSFTAGKE